jgi:hypothetical protein
VEALAYRLGSGAHRGGASRDSLRVVFSLGLVAATRTKAARTRPGFLCGMVSVSHPHGRGAVFPPARSLLHVLRHSVRSPDSERHRLSPDEVRFRDLPRVRKAIVASHHAISRVLTTSGGPAEASHACE